MPITDCCAVVGVWPRSPADLSVGALAAAMQARGVARAIAAHTAAIFYDAPAGNRAMEAVARETPGLLPAAVINPARFPACVTEAQRARAAGVVCFRFYPGFHGYPLAGRVAALRETLPALSGARLLQADLHSASAAELAELGDGLPAPLALTVDNDQLGLALSAARQNPRLLIETSRLTATGAIEAAVRALGVERVLFGSGAPLMALASAVISVQYAELADAERAAVLDGNVTRILGG